jgi:hypothetical protein
MAFLFNGCNYDTRPGYTSLEADFEHCLQFCQRRIWYKKAVICGQVDSDEIQKRPFQHGVGFFSIHECSILYSHSSFAFPVVSHYKGATQLSTMLPMLIVNTLKVE